MAEQPKSSWPWEVTFLAGLVMLAVTVPLWGPWLLVENALHKRRMRGRAQSAEGAVNNDYDRVDSTDEEERSAASVSHRIR